MSFSDEFLTTFRRLEEEYSDSKGNSKESRGVGSVHDWEDSSCDCPPSLYHSGGFAAGVYWKFALVICFSQRELMGPMLSS